MRAVSSFVLGLAALAACERPSPLVICHNANCASSDVNRDDTLSAMAESFALTFDGRPVLDGMEWDTFWDGSRGECLFAHDLNGDTATPASAAAQAIADHLATAPATWNGERFYTFIELKGFVGDSFDDRHTPEQFILHAECALDAAETIAAGAAAGGIPVTVGFIAGVPEHHTTLVSRPRWQTLSADPNLQLILIGDIFAPYSSIVPELSDFKVPLDAAEYHPDYMTAELRETYRSLGIDLIQWSFITTEEALDAINRWEPTFAISNEALLLRRWIEN
ncbi:MAG TPA: hypothetical protein VIV40_22990 [Kofleriaceae bacterium]